MKVYRIAKTLYVNDLSGEGARLHGGRWNRPGVPVLYTSQARSLALLELIVHFAAYNAIKDSFSFLSLEIPDVEIISIDNQLLKGNKFDLNNQKLWEISEHYFFKENVLGIKVPSILIPEESNIILNPFNPNFNQIKKISIDIYNYGLKQKSYETEMSM